MPTDRFDVVASVCSQFSLLAKLQGLLELFVHSLRFCRFSLHEYAVPAKLEKLPVDDVTPQCRARRSPFSGRSSEEFCEEFTMELRELLSPANPGLLGVFVEHPGPNVAKGECVPNPQARFDGMADGEVDRDQCDHDHDHKDPKGDQCGPLEPVQCPDALAGIPEDRVCKFTCALLPAPCCFPRLEKVVGCSFLGLPQDSDDALSVHVCISKLA